jgi:hypothetical protein
MKSHSLCFALISVAAVVACAPAQAQNGTLTRSFVSSAGSDSNACTITAPCASFAHAYTVIGANGIIAALDPGKYGTLNIVGPVTVNGNGWAAITGTATGSGITVNISGGTGNVILTGIEVDGAGAAYNGIVFESGASLTISDCIVKDFVVNGSGTGNGILIAPTSNTNFTVVNTIAVNNGNVGILYSPTSGTAATIGTIDHVVATNNTGSGIGVEVSAGSAAVSISNSVASNNGSNGIVTSGTVNVTVDNDEISNNGTGLTVTSGTVVLSRSVINNNATYGVSNSGTVQTLVDNRIYGNGGSTSNSNAVQGTVLATVTGK